MADTIHIPDETVTVTATPTDVETIPSQLPDQLALPQTPLANTIRNVIQTAQEREIIKTAPDVLVYLDGLPYLVNSYLNDTTTGQEFLVVNFNDHVQGFNASCDTDSLVPSGSINLSVPNYNKHMYQAPGGNNLIKPMMEVQVFAKGYYLSKRGNTIYHRVFKGLSSHVSHTDNGMTLEINIQIRGILRFMEIMQIDVNPALSSNSNRIATAYLSNQAGLDPYMQIADTFLRSVSFEGFQLNVIANKGQKVRGSDWQQAVEADYIVKWQTILNGLRADTHIMGYALGSVEKAALDTVTKNPSAIGAVDPEYVAAAQTYASNLKESDPQRDAFVNLVRGYTPDFGVGSIQLVNGRITSRLERIRHILQGIGFEGFQDINGEIIFKAPLYNLDVTKLAAAPSNDHTNGPSQADTIAQENNPFVVYLPEILSESETEDEGAVRCTRMSVQGNWSRTLQIESNGILREVASHIDIPKLAQFGLREEPARTVPWVVNGDKFLMYTYAANELVRQNRGYRTYNFTIPLRPELRLGFPMYLPHRDMYGYIKLVSMQYSIGNAATMSIVLDTIRKRPMFPSQRPTKGTNDPEKKETILTTQPNLVMKWTKPPQPTTSAAQTTDATPGGDGTARPSGTGDTPSNDPSVNLKNNPATQRQPKDKPVYEEQLRMANYRKDEVGTDWSTRADTVARSFRVQNDIWGAGLTNNPSGKPFFSRDKWLNPRSDGASGLNYEYYQAILTMQPYTDEKGYEVVGVFPFGRWKSLQEAIKETREGRIVTYVNPQAQEVLQRTDAQLFAGLGTPSSESSTVLLNEFKKLTDKVGSNTSFELDFSTPNAPGGDQTAAMAQPDNQLRTDAHLVKQTLRDVQTKVNLFITGTPQPLAQTQQELDITNENSSNTDFSTVLEDFKSIGKS
jgi:hypothetical protein